MRNKILPFLIFGLFFLAVPIAQLRLDFHLLLMMMPGDLGDARLNNYFLENIYQFLLGRSESLWHLGFFWPFPYVLGFSDNLFGAAPVYLVARILSAQPDTAFQIWFLAGYAINFWAAFHTFTKLGISRLSACIGAVIFTFAIPVSAHAGHAQLHYRFGVPLAFLYTIRFLECKQLWSLTIALGWLVWQFYCSIYIGFFTALLLLATTIGFFVKSKTDVFNEISKFLSELIKSWNLKNGHQKVTLVAAWMVIVLMLFLLFFPYLQGSKLYGVKRTWGEISLMLPRLQSYLIADTSWFWAQPSAKFIENIPMRHEHQMFPGLVCFALVIASIFYGKRTSDMPGRVFSVMLFAYGFLIISTIYIGGFSLWYIFHWLPLASAIRAMTRIDLIMLLPISFLVAYFLDQLIINKYKGKIYFSIFVVIFLLLDFSLVKMNVSSKIEWQKRFESTMKILPDKFIEKDVFFLATDIGEDKNKTELDAMWAALILGKKTMNGYSGSEPNLSGYSAEYGDACSVLAERIISFEKFSKDKFGVSENYQQLMSNVLPIGFVGCDLDWWSKQPQITFSSKEYSKEEFSKISFIDGHVDESNFILKIRLKNMGAKTISARSSIGKPIRVSWRYLDANCVPRSTWDNRRDLPIDIKNGGVISMDISLQSTNVKDGCGVEVSIVQELEFWGHDIGMPTLTVNFNKKK